MVGAEILKQEAVINTVEDYVFDTPITLAAGEWDLHLVKGHAWVFCETGNFTVTPHETVSFTVADGDITIRRLYVKSVVKFEATQYTI